LTSPEAVAGFGLDGALAGAISPIIGRRTGADKADLRDPQTLVFQKDFTNLP